VAVPPAFARPIRYQTFYEDLSDGVSLCILMSRVKVSQACAVEWLVCFVSVMLLGVLIVLFASSRGRGGGMLLGCIISARAFAVSLCDTEIDTCSKADRDMYSNVRHRVVWGLLVLILYRGAGLLRLWINGRAS
jgi:hypothetical protein